MATSIHPTAIIDPAAVLGENVTVGPYAIIEGDTTIGDGCSLGAGSIVRRYTTLGRDNALDAHVVIGGDPQDYGFDLSQRSYVRIGDGNIFREFCTINRATGAENATVVGDKNMFMTGAHMGHNAVVGDRCILINGCAMGGYAQLGDGVLLSAHVVIHQHCWVGDMVMTRGNTGCSLHIPPYCMLGKVNLLVGLNRVGLRRAEHITASDRKEIGEAHRLLYRSGLSSPEALVEMDQHEEWGEPAGKFRDFVRRALEAAPPFNRGLCTANPKANR